VLLCVSLRGTGPTRRQVAVEVSRLVDTGMIRVRTLRLQAECASTPLSGKDRLRSMGIRTPALAWRTFNRRRNRGLRHGQKL